MIETTDTPAFPAPDSGPVPIELLFAEMPGQTMLSTDAFDAHHQLCLEETDRVKECKTEAEVDACVERLLCARVLCLKDVDTGHDHWIIYPNQKRIAIGERLLECSDAYLKVPATDAEERERLVVKAALAVVHSVYPTANSASVEAEAVEKYDLAWRLIDKHAGIAPFEGMDILFEHLGDIRKRRVDCEQDEGSKLFGATAHRPIILNPKPLKL